MMIFLRGWVRSMIAASVTASLAGLLTPPGPVKKVTSFVCGILLLTSLLSPVLELDSDIFSSALTKYHATAAQLTNDMEQQEKQLLRTYIEQQTAAYILDEAQRRGLSGMTVSVNVKWRDESWVPCEVQISGHITDEAKEYMTRFFVSELGIPEDRQYWDE